MKQTEEVQEIARQSISQTKKVLHQRDSLFTELIKCRKNKIQIFHCCKYTIILLT